MSGKLKSGRSSARPRAKAAVGTLGPELERRLAGLRMTLNGAEHAPLYKSLEHLLRDSIQAHELKPGTILPGESELAERCGISRVTVRSALGRLVRLGLLTRRKGRRTEVAQRPFESDLTVLMSFTEEMRARGIEPETILSEVRRVAGDRAILEGLGLPARSEVIQLRRVRAVDGVPLVLFETHLPLWTQIPVDEPFSGSLYRWLADRLGIHPASADETLEAVGAPAAVARDLRVRRGTPLLLLNRRTVAADGRKIELTYGWYRADRYRYRLRAFCPPELRDE